MINKNSRINKNKASMGVLAIFVLAMFAARIGYGSGPFTYYVDVAGSDLNPGTITSPFLTIQHAANVALAGDTVIVNDGTYGDGGNCPTTDYNAVDITHAGTASALITFQAAHSRKAILNRVCAAHTTSRRTSARITFRSRIS